MTSGDRGLDERLQTGERKARGEILVDTGYGTRNDADEALKEQRSGGAPLEATLLQTGKLRRERIAMAIARKIGCELVEDDQLQLDRDAVSVMTEKAAWRYHAVPIRLAALVVNGRINSDPACVRIPVARLRSACDR